jgi:hypothetical protein
METTTADLPLVLVWSRTAWVDPCVQVHRAGCPHVQNYEGHWNWTVEAMHLPRENMARIAERRAADIGAPSVAWVDCALGLA